MSIGFTFRVGVLKLQGEDMPRLDRTVQGIRQSTREGLIRLRERDAAMRRLKAVLLRAAQDALAGG